MPQNPSTNFQYVALVPNFWLHFSSRSILHPTGHWCSSWTSRASWSERPMWGANLTILQLNFSAREALVRLWHGICNTHLRVESHVLNFNIKSAILALPWQYLFGHLTSIYSHVHEKTSWINFINIIIFIISFIIKASLLCYYMYFNHYYNVLLFASY